MKSNGKKGYFSVESYERSKLYMKRQALLSKPHIVDLTEAGYKIHKEETVNQQLKVL